MGTNYYRIPTEEEMERRKKLLIDRITDMKLDPKLIENGFSYIVLDNMSKKYLPVVNCFDTASPWDEFLHGLKIHLGKRSSGWRFNWNFHNNLYYSSKDELFEFIREGRVVDEYGSLEENEEFIKMALEWGVPNGRIFGSEEDKKLHPDEYRYLISAEPCKIIDGLIVSPHTEFC